jgi:hypothetical protein
MHTPEAKRTWQPGWVLGLALLSLVVPVAAVFLGQEPTGPFTDPAHVSYYRRTVAALVLRITCAAGAFVGNRVLTPAWLRWLSGMVATLGVLISAYWLWVLIGMCGSQVIWGVCTP